VCGTPSLASFALVGRGLGEAEPPAEPAQRVLLVAGKHAHLADEAGHMAGEDVGDEPAPRLGEGDGQIAAVVAAARALDQAPALEVAHHHRGVGVASQELLPEVALAERPVMQEGLHGAELPDREPGRRHHAADPPGQGFRRAHELDVGVEGRRLCGAAGVACRHGSNSNRL
jgi:hypothetical protein